MKTLIYICGVLFIINLIFLGYYKGWDRWLAWKLKRISIKKGLLAVVCEIAYWIDRLILKRIRFLAGLKYQRNMTITELADFVDFDDVNEDLPDVGFDIPDYEWVEKKFHKVMAEWQSPGRVLKQSVVISDQSAKKMVEVPSPIEEIHDVEKVQEFSQPQEILEIKQKQDNQYKQLLHDNYYSCGNCGKGFDCCQCTQDQIKISCDFCSKLRDDCECQDREYLIDIAKNQKKVA